LVVHTEGILMSQQNAVKFLQASGSDPKVMAALAKAERSAKGWLKVAAEAGFEVTPDELKTVAEALLRTKIQGDPIVALTAKDLGEPQGGKVELGDKQLGAVAGGVGAAISGALSSGLMARVSLLGAKGGVFKEGDSGPTWVNSPKHDFDGNQGMNY
jgi:hypothetical protein